MLSKQEIRDGIAALETEAAMLRAELEVIQARRKVFQAQCSHPDRHSYYAMGEPGVKCPDCKYQT